MVCQLNIYTIWSFLPWKKIYNKIYILQKQIYKSAQYCNFQMMKKYQKYLYNCNEIKILCIQNIINYIKKYYSLIHDEIYYIDDKDKFIIFQCLFTKCKINDISTFIIENVKKYIMYLCIEPEWYTQNNMYIINNITWNRYNFFKYYEKCILINNHNSKYKDIINYYRVNTDLNKYAYSYSKFIIHDNSNAINSKSLNINYKSVIWYELNLYKNFLYKKNILILAYKYINYINKEVIYNIEINYINQLKSIICYLNKATRLVHKINLTLYYVKKRISLSLVDTYNDILYWNKSNLQKIYCIINSIVYYWCKKKYKKNIFSKYTYIHNKLLNKTFYQNQYKLIYHLYIQYL